MKVKRRTGFATAASAGLAASSALMLVPAPSAQAGLSCASGTIYAVHRNDPNSFKVFDRYVHINLTRRTARAVFRSDSGGTVAASAGTPLSLSARRAALAKVKATVNAAVRTTMTARPGFVYVTVVKPHSTLRGVYGIYRERVIMKRSYRHSNCTTSAATYFAYSAPYRKGWVLHYERRPAGSPR